MSRDAKNFDHNLPERFSWFPRYITNMFPEYVIDEVLLVKESAFYKHHADRGWYTQNSNNAPVENTDVQLFSIKNAPKSLPVGHRLLLGFKDVGKAFNELDLHNPNLCAYWDTSTVPYEERAPKGPRTATASPDPDPYTIGDPIWKKDTDTIEREWNSAAFIDLTDAVNDADDFSKVTGIVFKWEEDVKNQLQFITPERSSVSKQPVWIVLKPFGE